MLRDSPPTQDAPTHQIWKFYLKEYRRYAPDSMQIIKTRSEVKVTVTQNETGHSAIPRRIHTPNLGFLPRNIRDILRTRLF